MSIHERLQRSLVAFASNSPSQGSVCDSPTFPRREGRSRRFSTERGSTTRLSAGLSLSQAQIDKWSLRDRIKELEAQLVNRDDVFKENFDLKTELQSSEAERLRVRDRLIDMNEKLREFVAKEQETRRRLESELSEAKDHIRIAMEENVQLGAEVAKAKKEASIVQDEMLKIKQLNAECIDRSVHERILSDMRKETDQLRASIEGSISAPVHDRALRQIDHLHSQLTEQRMLVSSMEQEKHTLQAETRSVECLLIERDETIAKLRGELARLESIAETHKSRISQLEKSVRDTKRENENNIESVRSELRKSDSKISELLEQLEQISEKEKRAQIQSSLSGKRSETDKARALGRVKRIREELRDLKLQVNNASTSLHAFTADQVVLLLQLAETRTSRLVEGMWKLMTQVELIDPTWPQPDTLTDFVIVLRSALKEVVADMRQARSEVASLSNDRESRDRLILELTQKVAQMQSGKQREEQMLSRLRDSIESAQFAINTRRKSIDGPLQPIL